MEDVNIREFTKDMLFKNVEEKDARILLDILNKPSKKARFWTEEEMFDHMDLIPDVILELDCEYLIIVIQNKPVDEEFSKRALRYVTISTIRKKNDKIMTLMVLSTAEESKIIEFPFSKDSIFRYQVVSLKDLDDKKII